MTKLNEIFITVAEKQRKQMNIASYILMAMTIILIIVGLLGLAIITSLMTTLSLVASNSLNSKIFILERELLEEKVDEYIKEK